MEDDDKETEDEARNRFSYIREIPGICFTSIERDIAAGKYVDGGRLAEALRENGLRPLTSPVLDYLCRYLEGNVEKPRGRKADNLFLTKRRNMLIRHYYGLYLAYLTDRKRRYGKAAGWTTYDDCSPAELAARMVARKYLFGEESWRSVQNIVSSRK